MDRNLNILVVDDEQIVLDSVRKHLRRENYDIATALTAQNALDIIHAQQIDIVITDLMMPEMDGLELMADIKQDHPNLPMVMITGYATINTALQANQLGAFDYIAKPFTRSELKSVVKRAADLVLAAAKSEGTSEKTDDVKAESNQKKAFKIIGENTWIMQQDDGTVRIGLERPFLTSIGKIQSVYMPEVGDELRQGSVCLQVFSNDLRAQALLSPLSGTVTRINESVLDHPNDTLQDPYEKGWLIHIDPDKFDEEIKLLGL